MQRTFLPLEPHGLDCHPKKRHKSTSDQGSGSTTNTTFPGGKLISDHISLVSHHQMAVLLEEHDKQPLPHCDEVFPWLHGYSGSKEPPRGYRWTAVIRSQPLSHGMIENSGLLKSSLDPHEFLMAWDHRKHSLESVIQDVAKSVTLSDDELKLLIHACKKYKLFPFLVTDADAQGKYGAGAAKNRVCSSTPTSQPNQSSGWKQPGMFRRFDLQVAKFIEMSHTCVVYCLNETQHWTSCHCQELAMLVYVARKCVDPLGDFKIGILNTKKIDPNWWGTRPMKVEALQKEKVTQLASDFDVASFNNWDRDLFYRERLEISKMSSASCVSSEYSTWCGNSTDFEIFRLTSRLSAHDSAQNNGHIVTGHQNLNTVVRLPNLATSNQRTVDTQLFNFPHPSKEWKFFVHCTESSALPELSKISKLLKHVQSEFSIDHTVISFPNSGSLGLGNLNLDSIKVILNTCYLIYCVGKLTSFGSLIYCSDGYTEASFLLVAYSIFVWDLPLDQVLFKLHKDAQRPFFLFPVDLQVLGHLQILLRELSPKRINTTTSCLEIDPDLFSKMFFIKYQDNYNLAQLKGPLPSKVLPHLYLGSLEHAQSPNLLQELDITNIVSVGETMPWLSTAISRQKTLKASQINYSQTVQRSNVSVTMSSSEITRIEAKSSKIDNYGSSIVEANGFRVLHITDVDDNGEDRLLAQLDEALSFIDECYKRDEKVLVHCMVGVSRSATVCIAECMRRLDCDILRAYLYVRVRRLNIIIQPNLMFVYELCKWQEAQGKRRTVDWHIVCRAISELNRMYF
ncbi:LAME_0F18690g1_1 [Lachancea meyersii CBS 8951]|uniref:LAME_0F18690g1_1 n=1 Tax=Lachancea meyersii CBS 8951 TaxID=1266667 RepID=A0A1G4K0U6_9SACH|nr:LAME_0F18690g1_1 [Lachancea meyersii CBS 8951]